MTFSDLQLDDALLRAVAAESYATPTPIQAKSIPSILEGRDLLGCAQTGTGKTAAFALPILQRLSAQQHGPRTLRCLVLAPTRELATQIGESFGSYGRFLHLRTTVVFGGVGQEPQVQALRRGVDILVATPGRLLDLINQGMVSFSSLSVLVLDEADRMLDMGFIRDVRRIIRALPTQRQTLFFSATMPPEIAALSKEILKDPVRVEVTPAATTADKVDQRVYFVAQPEKRRLLEHLLRDEELKRTLVFTRTKHGADKLVRQLAQVGIDATAIHGNKSQNARTRALGAFKSGACRILVATDIAARGIDVDQVSHVINFDLPNVPEDYVHRIGRTARAAASGIALSFCGPDERPYLKDIERIIRMRVPIVEDHPFKGNAAEAPAPPRLPTRPGQAHPRSGRHGRGVAVPPSSPPPAKGRSYPRWF
jgi:ATP-dependent RNA helicase RhlE